MKKNIKHLLDWKSWKDEEIRDLMELALKVKSKRWAYQGRFSGRDVAMIFQKSSTRTRISFEVGINELGGNSIYLDWQTTNFAITDIRYEAKYLSRTTSAILARLKNHDDLLKIIEVSEVPVINGCCNLYHPCQAFADCLTILQFIKNLSGTKLTYVGAYNNVLNSLVSICSTFGIQLTIVCPIRDSDSIDEESFQKLQKKGLLIETDNLKEAVKDAQLVYTDTWINMEFFDDPSYSEEKKKTIEKLMPYQLNAEVMKDSQAYIMHDMPIHAGYEITDELVWDKRSIIFDQAENRLDAQKAILIYLIEN